MVTIQFYLPKYREEVINLILDIQHNEFKVPIRLEEQSGLLKIPEYYQKDKGNFWIALDNHQLVGTIALLDLDHHQAALQKFFVRQDFRGKNLGIGQKLLNTLLDWAKIQSIRAIYLGTTEVYKAAHRFYEKNGFIEVTQFDLPNNFPLLKVDTKFYKHELCWGGFEKCDRFP